MGRFSMESWNEKGRRGLRVFVGEVLGGGTREGRVQGAKSMFHSDPGPQPSLPSASA